MTTYELGILAAQQNSIPDHLKQAYACGFEKGAMGSPFAAQKHQADQARKRKKKKPTPGSGAKDISKDYSGRTSQNRNASRLRAAGIDW